MIILSIYPSFEKLKRIHLITAYGTSTNVANYIHNRKNFENKNIFEYYFINKKESLFQIVLALNLTNFEI